MMGNSSSISDAFALLEECGQTKLVELIKARESKDDQERICAQILQLNKVTPKGIKDYCQRAKDLLEQSRKGVNPFDKFKPEVPTGVFLKPGEGDFDKFEEMGMKELHKTGFVLIAGGLGERLGYSGIKIDLPVCTIAEDYCYLKYYANYAHACRERAL